MYHQIRHRIDRYCQGAGADSHMRISHSDHVEHQWYRQDGSAPTDHAQDEADQDARQAAQNQLQQR